MRKVERQKNQEFDLRKCSRKMLLKCPWIKRSQKGTVEKAYEVNKGAEKQSC